MVQNYIKRLNMATKRRINQIIKIKNEIIFILITKLVLRW